METTFSLNSNFSLTHNDDGSTKIEGFAIHGGEDFIVQELIEVPESEMKNCARTLKGAKLMKDHGKTVDSIVGRVNNTKTTFDENANMQGVKYEASLVVDDSKLSEKIEKGLIDATSIGFKFDPECSICGNPFFSEQCTHHPFFDKDMHLIARNMQCHELSLVTFGADPYATVGASLSDNPEQIKEEFAKQKEEFIMSKQQDNAVETLQEEKAELSQKVRDLEAKLEQKEKDFKAEKEDLELAHKEEVLTLTREKEALDEQIKSMGEELSVFRAEAESRAEKELAAKKEKLVELAKELKTDLDDIDEMSAEFIDKQIAIFTKIIENTPTVKQFTGTEQPHEVQVKEGDEERKPFSSLGNFFGKQ